MPGRLAANSSNVSGPRIHLLEPFCFELVDAVLIVTVDFFQLCGDSSRVKDCGEMGLHGGEDLRPMRHDAEHVGDVAALGKSLVEECCQIRGHFATIKAGYAGHWASVGLHLWYRLRANRSTGGF